MTISDWVMILAIFLGPIVAVQMTKYLDANKEKRQRKLDIFKTLMSTRSYATSWDHVIALNRIDLEFEVSHQKGKAVVEAWKQYLDLLGDKTISGDQWGVKRLELLVELLHKMALVLDYDFDKTHIKNSSYFPEAHENMENQQAKIREGIIDIIEGKLYIPMNITNWPKES